MKLHDGARVVPVHAVWLVIMPTMMLFLSFTVLHSGLWGVVCVGLFSRSCLIKEVYETVCYCRELVLPKTVSYKTNHKCFMHDTFFM